MEEKEIPLRKAINFDLKTSEIKKIYKSNNPFVYLKAYKEICAFLENKGFTHRQWSGYTSNEPLTYAKTIQIIKELNNTLPWLKKCVNKFDITNIGDTFDLTYIFKGSNKEDKTILPDKSKSTENVDKENSRTINAIFTRSDLKQSAAKISKESGNIPEPAHRKNDREL